MLRKSAKLTPSWNQTSIVLSRIAIPLESDSAETLKDCSSGKELLVIGTLAPPGGQRPKGFGWRWPQSH